MTKIDQTNKRLIIDCMAQRLHEKESLQFLKSHDIQISVQSLRQWKSKIRKSRFRRINELANTGYIDYHLDCIDTIEWAKAEMIKKYGEEKDPYKAADILVSIVNLLPLMTSYVEESKEVMLNKAISESTKREKELKE